MASLFSSVSSIMILLSLFMLFFVRCYADSNDVAGSSCSYPSEAESPTWTENLNSLFTALEANVIINNGYYRAEAGEKGADKVYGIIQCRSDISKSNCTDCTKMSFRSSSCNGRSRSVVVWQRWCLLRYTNASFNRVWEEPWYAVYPTNSSSLEEPEVVAKGRMMMMGLPAAAAKESLKFAKAEMDDGKGGKRYGLAQCTRDLGMSDCRDCLEFLLKKIGSIDKRSWGVYGVSCFMLYDDTHLYFNTSAEEGLGEVIPSVTANRALAGRLTTAITIFMTAIMAFL